MNEFTYAQVTQCAEDTIVQLTKEAKGELDESNQSYWDMAQGVVRLWVSLTGPHGRPDDLERLQLLIDDMPGADDDGEGNWRPSPVVVL